jgi:hypothetical protein
MDGDRTLQGAWGPIIDICRVDGGRFWIFSSGTSQGARHRHFLTLMVDASESLALTPPRRLIIDVF